MMDDARWTQSAPSEYAWEGSALAYLKSVIPRSRALSGVGQR